MDVDGVSNCCRITDIKPTVENVIPYNRYKKTQPEINGVPMINVPAGDQLLLMGGGRDFILSLLQDDKHRVVEGVELFILNIGIVLWFEHLEKGIEIPYESIIYHGSVRTSDTVGHQLALLATLTSDPLICNFFQLPESLTTNDECTLSSIEIMLRPKYSLYDRHYNTEIESLFTFEDFGVNRGDEMVDNCNHSLAACLEMYCSTLSDTETDATLLDEEELVDDDEACVAAYAPLSETLNMLDNSGLADDLGAPVGAVPQQMHH